MFKKIRQTIYPLLGLTRWNEGGHEGRFVDKRYVRETDTWEIRELTPEQQEDAYWWWAIK